MVTMIMIIIIMMVILNTFFRMYGIIVIIVNHESFLHVMVYNGYIDHEKNMVNNIIMSNRSHGSL